MQLDTEELGNKLEWLFNGSALSDSAILRLISVPRQLRKEQQGECVPTFPNSELAVVAPDFNPRGVMANSTTARTGRLDWKVYKGVR